MRMVDLIECKKRGGSLTQDAIGWFIQNLPSLPDEQVAALLMAICIRGMNREETAALTLAMAASGQTADLSSVPGVKVDKHSTGGVGDLTTLVAAPLAASCGVKVAKMSGRSLGHTGGTLDKLWSVPGLRTDLSMEQFTDQVRRIGCAIIGQTGQLAPADKRLYALRDATATVDSLPLIVSSILSKKIAAGCDAILLDVKTGSGALMPTLEDSLSLAREMVEIGRLAGRRMMAMVTDMDQPLGRMIGNALEVREAVDILAGREQGRARELCLQVASRMVTLGLGQPYEAARAAVKEALTAGDGLQKLAQMMESQGGDSRVVQHPSLLPQAKRLIPILAQSSGVVEHMDAAALGVAAQMLGAGRQRKEDAIDPAVGVEMARIVGDSVQKGDVLATLHANEGGDVEDAAEKVRSAIRIGRQAVIRPLVYEIIE